MKGDFKEDFKEDVEEGIKLNFIEEGRRTRSHAL